jgi:hypothetical protein
MGPLYFCPRLRQQPTPLHLNRDHRMPLLASREHWAYSLLSLLRAPHASCFPASLPRSHRSGYDAPESAGMPDNQIATLAREPRWPAFVAMLAACLYWALPERLSVGPGWLLFPVIFVLLIPTAVSHYVVT